MFILNKWGDMPQRSYRWTSALVGVALYSLVFIFAHRYWITGETSPGGQPELLMFVLPGLVMALLHADTPLRSTLLMALWGTLLASLLLNSALMLQTHLLLLSLWSLSAIFWAGCGALLVRLLRILLAMSGQR